MSFLKYRLAAILAAILLCTASLHAQLTSGNITGTVIDQSGASIPDATVVAKNLATGVESSVTSTGNGTYRIANLLPGKYDVTATAAGFTKTTTAGVDVFINKTITADVQMSVGQSSTVVNVAESSAAVDTTTAQIQTSFETKQLTDLPTASSGAGVINLSLLAPGVASSGAVGAGTGPSVGGQRPRNNNFTIEGVDNNNFGITGPLVTIPNDAVQEFSLLQNQFSAEFGRNSGGQFNQVVKGGTNQFHGMVLEYFQNRNLNATDNLNIVQGLDGKPRYDQNRFGGNLGGPVLRNKLFFFGDYEYNPLGQTLPSGLVYAPTQAGYNTLTANSAVNQNNLSVMKQYLGTAAVADPTFNRGRFPVVSGSAIPVGQITIPGPSWLNTQYGVGSLDYNASDKDSMRGRFIVNRLNGLDNTANLPAFYTNLPQKFYLATFSEYHNFTPNLINEFRLGFNRFTQNFVVGPQTFPGLDAFPNVGLNDLQVNIGPNENAPQFTYQNNYQLTDNLSWTRGAHNIKFGFDGLRNISPQSFTQRARGDYQYTTLGRYLLDLYPDNIAQRSVGDFVYWGNRWLWGGYVNDNWKIRPNLTINLGLRYEYHTIPAGETLQTLNAASSVPGLITFGAPKAQTTNWMPRVGLAYTPGNDGRTTIRAGFGINYDVLFDNFGLLTLPPQLQTTQDVTGQSGTGFLANGGLRRNPSQTAALTVAEAREATSGYVPDAKRPKSLQWNFGIQRQLGSNYVFQTQYLGTRGINLPVQAQINRQPIVNSSNALPVFFSQPSQATLNSLTNTLENISASLDNGGNIVPAYANAGFTGLITSYMPIGNSTYHAWLNQLSRRFSNGIQLTGAYTWSHNIDDSTAEVFSTTSTPRRPQNIQNLRPERSSSALDHRQRLTFQFLYDWQAFKNSNWLMKNVVSNWSIAPIYTYQTGTLYTVQSGIDSNQNGDSAGDRAIVNPNGNPNVGSGTTSLTNSAGDTVGYLVNNPNAGYIQTPLGALSNGGRNTAAFNPINNIDVTVGKRYSFNDRSSVQFTARILNVLNHSQYTGGFLSDVTPPAGLTGATVANVFRAASGIFADPTQAFSSNPRTMQLALKFIF